jgi:hypothetical protein
LITLPDQETNVTLANRTDATLIRNIDDLARISKLLADSGYFNDAREAAQAGVKVLAGLEMGIGPFSAMAGIHVIKGKPAIGAGLMAAAVKRSGKYDYRVLEHTRETCRIQFLQNNEPIGVSEFNLDDARAANLLNNDSWKKAPRNMLFARALSNGVRWYAPDVFDVSTYVPEEMGAEVDDEGNVVRIEPVTPARATSTPTAAGPIIDIDIIEPTPSQPDPNEPDIAPITTNQLKQLAATLKNLGVINPKDARAIFTHMLERDINTSRDLTSQEAEMILSMTTDEWTDTLTQHAQRTA